MCLTAVLLWRANLDRRVAESTAPAPERKSIQATQSEPKPQATKQRAKTTTVSYAGTIPATRVDFRTAKAHATEWNPHRLSNTRRPFDDLIRRDNSILLRNAFIDTDATMRGMPIPHELQAGDESGAWLVQAEGGITPAFLDLLHESGAQFSEAAYIPNNTYVIRAGADVARRLEGSALVHRAVPYEPFYKLDSHLLGLAMDRLPPPVEGRMRLTLFPGERDKAVETVQKAGARILSEEPTPFGPSLIVLPDIVQWTKLARIPEVQGVERHMNKMLLNDLTRKYLHVSTNVMDTDNYLGLSGTNVVVYVNDGDGLDIHHPDLTTNRAHIVATNSAGFTLTTTNDPGGHMTFVTGIIASDGSSSPAVSQLPDGSTNIPGSYTGSDFRGVAHQSTVIGLNFDTPLLAESQFAEIHARTNLFLLQRTNTVVINNSWGFDGVYTYDSAAAIWDAAVRDAIPAHPGMQQTLPVFAAGNDGWGADSGLGGFADRINSPASFKNGITVGASEQVREITNQFFLASLSITNTCITNMVPIYLGRTDSSNQVASFSSRGNVDPSDEGDYGRFKPDMVAPGTFPVSLRSTDWNFTNRYTANNVDYIERWITNIVVQSTSVWSFAEVLPYNATNLFVGALNQVPGAFDLLIHSNRSPNPSATMGNLAAINSTNFPMDPTTAGTWFFDIENTNNVPIEFDMYTVITITNCAQEYDMVLSNLNERVGPHNTMPQGRYRFATGGTSYSAPAVSGLLALVQEFFEGTNILTDPNLRRTNSAAMLKALLINSSRGIDQIYDYNMESTYNYQGWGMPSIRRVIAPIMATEADAARWPIQMRDMTGTNSIATDQAHVYDVTVSPEVTNVPLRVTLTWSDPPGNPSAAVKLVNDLDVYLVSDVSGEVYRGNTFNGNGEFSLPVGDTNKVIDPVTGMPIPVDIPTNDVVNNVENIYVPAAVDTSYKLYVVGNRVNVNAVSAHTNEITQDYALVVSSANGDFAGGLTMDDFPMLETNYVTTNEPHRFSFIDPGDTNAPLTSSQRAGANSPLAHSSTTPISVATNGWTNQWVFFHVVNSAGGSNAAFITFRPDNVSIPRNDSGDVDLYVSTDPGVTNLDVTAIANATKSLSRDGTEVITFSNSVAGDEYYVGVKSEDQQAVDFGFFTIFTDDPFANDNGDSVDLFAIGAPAIIPDGSPQQPGGTNIFLVNPFQIDIRRVIVTNSLTHQLMGDLVADLEHEGERAILLNHRADDARGGLTYIFEDSEENNVIYPSSTPAGLEPYYGLGTNATRSAGPGGLGNFVGEEGAGLWIYTIADNKLFHTGFVSGVSLRLERAQGDNNGNGGPGGGRTNVTVRGMSTFCDFTFVPPGSVSFEISVEENGSSWPGPLELYVRRGDLPTTNMFDHSATIQSPGGSLTITIGDDPALNPGRYFVCVVNPNNASAEFLLSYDIEIDFGVVPKVTQFNANQMEILDDVRTNGTFAQIPVALNREVAGVRAGIRVAHERASDLAVRLVSPSGTDVLLTENRGLWATNGYGFGSRFGEIAYSVFGEDLNIARLPVKFVTNEAFVPFIPPKVLATNWLEGTSWTLNTDTTTGNSNETVFLLPVGLTTGDITINYNFFSQPDRLQVYERNAGVATLVPGADTMVVSSLQDMFTFAPADVDDVADTITVTGHTYSDGDRVILVNPWDPAPGGSASAQLPGGISHTVFYLARNIVGDTFSLEVESNGNPVDITSQGTGTHRIWGRTPSVTRSFTQTYNSADGLLEIVVNQGSGTPGTGWDYSFSLNPDPGIFPDADQAASGITAYDGRVFVVGDTSSRGDNGIVSQFSTPMLDDSKPFYSLNWPGLQGGTVFNDVAATAAGVFAVGRSYTQTTDPDVGIANKEAKGVVARFAFDDPAINTFDVQGSDFHLQIPNTSEGIFSPHGSGGTDYAGEEEAHGIVSANENGTEVLYIVGEAPENAANPGRMFLSKMDTSGVFDWHTNDLFNMTADAFSAGHDVAVDGTNVFVAGINGDGGTTGPYIMALDTNGVPQWTWTTNELGAFNAITTLNDHIYAAGTIEAVSGSAANAFLAKLDFSGNVVWTRAYDQAGQEDVINGILPFGNRVYAVGASGVPGSPAPLTTQPRAAGPMGNNIPGTGEVTFTGAGGTIDIDIGAPLLPAGPPWPETAIMVSIQHDPSLSGNTATADYNTTIPGVLYVGYVNNATTVGTLNSAINTVAGFSVTGGNAAAVITEPPISFIRDAIMYEVGEDGSLITIPAAGYTGITTYDTVGSDESFNSITTDGFDVYVAGSRAHNNGMDPDDVLLVRYSVKEDILPEESLNEFIGESAAGNWRLEIWDDRVGGETNIPPELLSWQLQFDLTVTNRTPVPLTHTNTLEGTVTEDETRYFVVHVPFTATEATIDIESHDGGLIDLYFNQTALPLLGFTGDVQLQDDVNATPAQSIINTTTSTPTLVPGQRFYLAIENDDITETHDFEITVTFNSTATTFAARGAGSLLGTAHSTANTSVPTVDQYQFTVYAGEPRVHFDVKNLDGEVRLRLRRGAIPDSANFDFEVEITGGTTYSRTTLEPGAGLPLIEGTWFASIEAIGSDDATYEIEIIGENAPPVVDPISSFSMNEGGLLSFGVSATDPNTPLNYTLVSGPAGAVIDAGSGVFTWTPTEAQGPGFHSVTVNVTDSGIPPLSSTKSFSIDVAEVNQAPVLPDLGDLTIDEGQTLNVAATAIEYDVPANTPSYLLATAPVGAAINPTTGIITWTPGEREGGAAYLFDVVVTDDGVPPASASKRFQVSVSEVNTPPSIEAVEDVAILELTTLRITNSASDVDLPAQQIVFSLEQGAPAGMTIDAATGILEWTPTEAQGPGVYTIGVAATDNGIPSKTSIAHFEITVLEDNQAPAIQAVASQTIDEGESLSLNVAATDPDLPAQSLTYSLDGAPTGMTIEPATGAISWTPTEAQGPATYAIEAVVSDNAPAPLTDRTTFVVEVMEINQAPFVEPLPDLTVTEGASIQFTMAVTDVDLPANAITHSFGAPAPAGATLDPVTGAFSWMPSEAQGPGVYTITVVAVDNGTPQYAGRETFAVTVEETNTAPSIQTLPIQDVVEGETLVLDIPVSDPDQPGNRLQFNLEPGSPAGVGLNPDSGSLTWTPGEVNGETIVNIGVRVTDDGNPVLSDVINIQVRVLDGNSAPRLTPIGGKSVDEGETLSFMASAIDSDQPANDLTFGLRAGAPAGATIDPDTGLFSWTPTETDGSRVFFITVEVTDDGSPALSHVRTFSVSVGDVNQPPVLYPISDATADEGVALVVELSATDPDLPVDTLEFSIEPGSPAGVTVHPSSGALSWTPSEGQGPGTHVITVRVSDGGTPELSDLQSFSVTVNEVNVAPTLEPVGGHTFDEDESIRISPEASDVDLPVNVIRFSLDPGAPVGMTIDPVTGVIDWQPGESDGPAEHTITIRVTDNGVPVKDVAEAVTLTLREVNRPPVLAPIGDRTVDELNALSFVATATDPDLPANDLEFALDGAPAGAAIDPDTGVFMWTPTEEQGAGVYQFDVVVTDGGVADNSDRETITVTVGEVNTAPAIADVGDQAVDEGGALTVDLTASDVDLPANGLTFSLDPGAPEGMAIDPATGRVAWSPGETLGGQNFAVTARVEDDGVPAKSGSVSFNVSVVDLNSAPELVPVANQSVAEGSTLSFAVAASDPDLPADDLVFSLEPGAPAGMSIHPESGVIAWSPNETQGPSSNLVTVRVTDNGDGALSATATFTVEVEEVNNAPTLDPISDRTVAEGATLSVATSAVDSDVPADGLAYSLEPGAPVGMTINAVSGVVSWTPGEDQGPGVYTVAVRVMDDGDGAPSDVEDFTVTVTESNSAPTLAAIDNRTVDEGALLTVNASASDVDEPANRLTFSLGAGAPEGAVVDPETGVFSWTPAENQGGQDYVINVVVVDDADESLSDSELFVVTVRDINSAPTLESIGNRSIAEGQSLALRASASDTDIPADGLRYTLGANPPSGMTIDPETGDIAWTPEESQGPESYQVTVIVTDDGEAALSDSTVFEVNVDEVNVAPELAAIGGRTVNEGGTVSFTASATDSDEPANGLTFSLDSGAPEGAVIDPQTGQFVWTTTESDGPGVFSVTVRVTDDGDGSLSDFETVSIQVDEVNVAPELASIAGPTVDELTAVSVNASATDADLPANRLTYSLGAGAPEGASIDPQTGLFAWTPSETQGPGSYTIEVRVSDDADEPGMAAASFVVQVSEANAAPALAPIGDLMVNEGDALSFTAVVSDSDIPANGHAFSLGDNAPVGASIDPETGVFSWTPTEAQGPETYAVEVRVTDDGSPAMTATQTVSIRVDEVNEAPRLLTMLDQSVAQCGVLNVIAFALDGDQPKQDLVFSLGDGAPVGASIDASTGVVTFEAPSTTGSHEITVVVADSGEPAMTDSRTFRVTVTELATSVVRLENAVAMEGVADGCNSFKRFYQFTVPAGATRALFELYDLNGNVDLLLRRNETPAADAHDAVSAAAGSLSERIVIPLGDGSEDISGVWYVAVRNEEAGKVEFKVRATIPQQVDGGSILVSGEPLKVEAAPIVSATSSPTLNFGTVRGEKYVVEVSDDLLNWTNLTEIVVSDSSTSVVDPTPFLDNSKRFYRIRQVPH